MSKTIQTVKLVPGKTDDINALAQYIRSDMSKAMASVRRRDEGVFRDCVVNIRAYLSLWEKETVEYLEKESSKKTSAPACGK